MLWLDHALTLKIQKKMTICWDNAHIRRTPRRYLRSQLIPNTFSFFLANLFIVESWKVRKRRPCCCSPGTQSSPYLQQRKTRIGQLNLCRMKLPYRQRQQERPFRVRRDHKLALRTTFAALLLVVASIVSAAATIQPPEVRRTAITRERLCWNDHADKSEREGAFQRKCRMKRRTFKELVALLRPALERDYCKNSGLTVS